MEWIRKRRKWLLTVTGIALAIFVLVQLLWRYGLLSQILNLLISYTDAIFWVIYIMIDWGRNREKPENRDKEIAGHISKLLLWLRNQSTSDMLSARNLSWRVRLQVYQYKEQIRQHLFTAHKDTFLLLEKTEKTEIESKRLYQETYDQLTKKIDAGSLPVILSSEPWRDPANIMLNESTPHFEAKRSANGFDGSPRWRVWFGDMPCSLPFSDIKSAEDYATKLNNMAQKESENIKKCREAIQQARNVSDDFERSFEQWADCVLAGGFIDTKSEACEYCLKLHTGNDVKRLTSELVKMRQ